MRADQARFGGTESSGSVPVRSFGPNPWGFFDMHGNVWEWCQDGYDRAFYDSASAVDPLNASKVERRVLRGGSFYFTVELARSAHRRSRPADDRNYFLGLRPARDVSN